MYGPSAISLFEERAMIPLNWTSLNKTTWRILQAEFRTPRSRNVFWIILILVLNE